MNIRTFIFGVVCGAGLYATIELVLNRNYDSPAKSVETKSSTPLVHTEKIGEKSSQDPVQVESHVDPISNDVSPEISAAEVTWLQSERAILESEPKDDAWAYFAEQSISQFLTGHPDFVGFDVEYIECRTTKCQIRVAGYDESTGPTWQKVMFDMYREPWAEFGETGNAFGRVDGRFVILETMTKPAPRQ